jgi:glycosyltransferase involved in cell wall biosynthesis
MPATDNTLKRVAIVAPHFVPSNLAAVHRTRLWAQHLAEFGWQPIVVTTHHDFYEEELDPELELLVDPRLRVIRTRAFATKPVRLVGDIGVRALPWHYSAIASLMRNREIDFLHITIPSNYSALLGRLLHARFRVPYGIDYIDPWVHVWPGAEKRFSKAWWSCHLAQWLEPWAVRRAALITGVAPRYFESVIERNPHLRKSAVTASMPYGNSVNDFEIVRRLERAPSLFERDDGRINFVYAGAMLPKAFNVLELLFEAIKLLLVRAPDLRSRLRLYFVGTGKSPNDPTGFNVLPVAERMGLEQLVHEHPQRMRYLDVLNHLQHADAILVVGSQEPHYTPSKIFQAIDSLRPVFAMLHEQSTAANVLKESRAGAVVELKEDTLPDAELVAVALERFLATVPRYESSSLNRSAFEKYSARASAEKFARALNVAIEREA